MSELQIRDRRAPCGKRALSQAHHSSTHAYISARSPPPDTAPRIFAATLQLLPPAITLRVVCASPKSPLLQTKNITYIKS
ncbi:g12353 [Coccomyxa viridis]|uniref:G12353 protein n=1 Tax=Coccomyxa viridis TaxID=1274662 RepID=A0ABP1GH56_9CHLO